MIIRETGEDDLGQVMTIIRMAQQSFRDQGVDQWQDGYPNEEVILEDIRKGQSYVAEEKGIILGTAVISFEKEKTYDGIENGQWLTPGDTKYMVIHRIATHYEYKRRGTAPRGGEECSAFGLIRIRTIRSCKAGSVRMASSTVDGSGLSTAPCAMRMRTCYKDGKDLHNFFRKDLEFFHGFYTVQVLY